MMFSFLSLSFVFLLSSTLAVFTEDKIEVVPLINLEELSPTFEEDKDELESMEDKNIISAIYNIKSSSSSKSISS